MGVKFHELFKEEELSLKDLRGKTVAVDGMNMLFQILYNPIQMKKNLADIFYLDSTQRVITHLYGWAHKIRNFYSANIFPIVVFDGKPDSKKRLVSKNYAKDFTYLDSNYRNALERGDLKSAKSFALSKSYMWTNCIRESIRILESAGIPVIMAPSEAEAQCAWLVANNHVDYMVSNDYDSILFGATHIIRKITFQSRKLIQGKWRSYKPSLKYINTEKNLRTVQMTKNQLIDLSILMGNDYFKGIPKIGQTYGIAAIKKYHSLDNMIKKHPKLFTSLHSSKLHEIRDLFYRPFVQTTNLPALSPRPFNQIGLTDLFLKDHSLNPEKATKTISNLKKAYEMFLKRNKLKVNTTITYKKSNFDKHLQRRLDRGKKKKNYSDPDVLEFMSAASLK